MTPEDAIEVLTKMAGSWFKNTDNLRVHVRNHHEIIRRSGKKDEVNNLYSVAVSGDVKEAVWMEAQDESLEAAIQQLFLQMAENQHHI